MVDQVECKLNFRSPPLQKGRKIKEKGIHRDVVGSLISSKGYTAHRGDRHKIAESKGRKRPKKRFFEQGKNAHHDNKEDSERKREHFGNGIQWL